MTHKQLMLILGLAAITGLMLVGQGTVLAESDKSQLLLVKFASAPSASDVATEAQRLQSSSRDLKGVRQTLLKQAAARLMRRNTTLGIEIVAAAQEQSTQELARKLAASPLVEWAEPNYRYRLFTPLVNSFNDPYYQSEQAIGISPYHGAGQIRAWWIDQVKTDQVFAEQLITSAHQVVIAILDSGVRLTHEDLNSKIIAGYDFVNQDQDPSDDDGHGTHVAGIAAAAADNNLGIAGIGFLQQIKIMPVKVMDSQGDGYVEDIANGIIWAADQGAQVINMSFGGPEFSQILASALTYAHAKGCVLVAAAGNYGASAWDDYGINPVMYPASNDHVISVAATNSSNARAAYSEFNQFVDLAAPGGDVVPLYPSGLPDPAGLIISSYYLFNNQYVALYGTSMASPNVAGAAALLLAQQPTATPEEIETLLTSTADKIDSLQSDRDGYNEFLGWGQINLYQALRRTSTYPVSNQEKGTYNFPNPFNPVSGAMTHIIIPKTGNQATLIIMNSFGSKVKEKTLAGSAVTAGLIVSWDGRDGSQSIVANGVYPYLLKIDGTVYKNKIVVKQ